MKYFFVFFCSQRSTLDIFFSFCVFTLAPGAISPRKDDSQMEVGGSGATLFSCAPLPGRLSDRSNISLGVGRSTCHFFFLPSLCVSPVPAFRDTSPSASHPFYISGFKMMAENDR